MARALHLVVSAASALAIVGCASDGAPSAPDARSNTAATSPGADASDPFVEETADDDSSPSAPSAPDGTSTAGAQPTNDEPTTAVAVEETTTTASTTTASTTSTTTSTTLPAGTPAAGPLDLTSDRLVLGTSVLGREIVAERVSTPGGRRVLVIGVIHGNEDAGIAIVDELRRRGQTDMIPDEVELWLVDSMNPDGQAAEDRHNANEVDLNRNFPHDWTAIGSRGDSQYSGTGPASEPETRAIMPFIEALRPDIAVWYHQDANLIIPSSGRQGRIRARYAELTGLPLADCCSGGVYTGVAATWARLTLADQEAVPFIVELPGGALDSPQVTTHADAVVTISVEG